MNFQCRYCDKFFGYPSTLIRHERTHTHEKPYSCEFCEARFSARYSAQRHQRHCFFNPGRAPQAIHQCQFCGQQFKFETHLSRHWKTCCQRIQCSECLEFLPQHQLIAHRQFHFETFATNVWA